MDTLAFLRRRFPRARFVWIMGADNLRRSHRWRGWRAIARMMPIAVIDRPGYTLRAILLAGGPLARPLSDRNEAMAPALPGLRPPAWVFLARSALRPVVIGASFEMRPSVKRGRCTGVALSLITQPDTFSHPALSHRVRDAVLREMLVDGRASDRKDDRLKSVALQMATLIQTTPTPLTEPEVSMMLQWLGAVASSRSAATSTKPRTSTLTSPRRHHRQ